MSNVNFNDILILIFVIVSLFDVNENILRIKKKLNSNFVVITIIIIVIAFVLLRNIKSNVRLNIIYLALMKNKDMLSLIIII